MTSYSDAVQALAESIVAPDMSRQEKIDVVKSILSRNGASREVSIDLSDDAFRVLRSYLSEIQGARDAEIGRNLEASVSNAKRLLALRDDLKEDLSRASSEDDELKKIARRLQDSGLGKIAGMEEDQINELGRKLEKLEEKGREVEGLENRLEAVLAEHGLERSNIDSELQKRASKVSRLLENHSGDPDTVDVDAIVDAVADEEALLERAEAQNSSELKNDLEKLSELYGHKERESAELDNVEEALQEGRFDDAEASLDLILTDRDAVLDGDISTLKELHSDLEGSVKISSGLKKLFSQIDLVESRDGIDADEFYTKLADRLDLQDKHSAKQFIGKLRHDYGDMKEELRRIEDLKEHSLERDKSNYEKIKQIDEEDSQLRRKASSMEAQQKLKDIHEKLQRLGYELENEIKIEGGEASDTSSEDTGTDDSGSSRKRHGWDDDGREWRDLLDNPNSHIDAASGLASYNQSTAFSYPEEDEYVDTGTAPYQGYKIHVSAYPAEGYQVCRELIPILQDLEVNHKIMHSHGFHRNWIESRGKDDLQIKKFMTIYTSAKSTQVFCSEDSRRAREHNKEQFNINRDGILNILREILDRADSDVLRGGPEVEGNRSMHGINFKASEYRVGDTRLFVNYTRLGGGSIGVVEDYDELSGGSPKSIGNWVRDVEKIDGESRPANLRHARDDSRYYLDHLISKSDAEQVEESLVSSPRNALIGLDGKIAGAYYLPPPEAEREISDLLDDL